MTREEAEKLAKEQGKLPQFNFFTIFLGFTPKEALERLEIKI